MSCEVEIKARIGEEMAEGLRARLAAMPGSRVLGEVGKVDTYYALHETDHHLFRLRRQSVGGEQTGLVTAKPLRSYDATELNQEVEFHVPIGEMGTAEEFFKSLGYVVCLTKSKTGWACVAPFQGFDVTCEILRVEDAGDFLEAEITSVPSFDEEGETCRAQRALVELLGVLGIGNAAIESRPYRTLILESRARARRA